VTAAAGVPLGRIVGVAAGGGWPLGVGLDVQPTTANTASTISRLAVTFTALPLMFRTRWG
jgi:hypothetical protein